MKKEYSDVQKERLFALIRQPRGNPKRTQKFMRKWFRKYTSFHPTKDQAGNFHHQVGREEPRTLFLAHTDTVDSPFLRKPKRLGAAYLRDRGLQLLQLDPTAYPPRSEVTFEICLGADDAAGCETLVQMVEAGVPGYYIWAAEEEKGSIGINFLLSEDPGFFSGFDRCVSFDRRGGTDLVTNQYGEECCSETFADALLEYLPAHKTAVGSFTDSGALKGVIPECINLSVGYYYEHGTSEVLDLWQLNHLIGLYKAVPWEQLPTERDPLVNSTWQSYEDEGGMEWHYLDALKILRREGV